MRKNSVVRLAGVAALCAMLTACGGEALPVSSSASASSSASVSASSSAEPTATTAPVSQGKQLTADLPVEGALTLVESDVFDGYDGCVSPFYNGWAFVFQNDEVGYLSEEGEYKALYSATETDLIRADFSGIPYIYEPGMSTTRRQELYWSGHTFRCNENGVVPYFQNGLWGYSDLDGNIVVEPIYEQISWLGKLGYGKRSVSEDYGGTGSTYSYYDIFNSSGQVIATSVSHGWVEPELGYYMLYDEEAGKLNLYNMDGTLIVEDVPHYDGNCCEPDFDVYSGGVVVNGVACDRTGKVLDLDAETIDVLQPDLVALYDSVRDEDTGVSLDGEPLLATGLWLLEEPDENGCRYLGVQGSSAVRLYDAAFEEMTTPPLLRTVRGEQYENEEGQTVQPVRILDQDGNELMVLEAADVMEYPVYCPVDPLEEGDWLYWCPDKDTRIPYRVTAAE